MIPDIRKLLGSLTLAGAGAMLAACGGGTGTAASGTAAPGINVPTPPTVTAAQTPATTSAVTNQQVDSENGMKVGQNKAIANAYIVQMAEMPVTAYTGNIKGMQATKPRKGQKIDPNSPAVINYMAYLASKHDAVLAKVGNASKFYSYGYVFNGFAARMSDAQAQKMAKVDGVVAVTRDEARTMDTSSTPTFLGLSGPSGFWAQTSYTGENVIIGMVDSGIWPEHPSFSDRTGANGNASKDGKLSYQQIPGWHGKCTPGDAFTATNCNQKLIGARYYNAGFGGNDGIRATFPWEYVSPRDHNGHGTHTSSTAGGNANVPATGAAAVFGSINGMAPRARIATYKVCWNDLASGTCATTDSVAAIDQAVADGVDVINFSISGTSTNFRDPVEIAFLFAADAGVFVAASAGNSGPANSTVAHPGPWLTTVAAGTHNRNGVGSVTQGDSVTYSGASVATALGPVALIDATAAGLPGADPTQVRRCYGAADGGAVLDPVKVAGKIVVCDRGIIARVNKSLAVKDAGGVGMVLLNPGVNSINADFHSVPTIHLQYAAADRAAQKAYAATPGATATINGSTIVYTTPAPFTAAFSSRGPLKAAGGDLLKPDIIAPGQDILAAVAPPGNNGRLFDLYSGTSMSSPHIAGIAALFKQARPEWSPMAIKSALMTTAGDILDSSNTSPSAIFRQGAGHVRPSAAMDPGLVFDSGYRDWLNFICGTQPSSFCSAFTPIDPSDFNVASIAIGDLAGTQTVTRRVTNVGGNPATYSPTIAGMDGFTVAMNPPTLTLASGETKPFTVSFTRGAAALGAYSGGQLTLSDGAHTVRIPMVVQPVALAAPANASGTYSVKFGFNGTLNTAVRGLVPAGVSAGSVSTNNYVDIPVVVPASTTLARFSLFDSQVNLAGTDLDLEVYNSSMVLKGSSGGATANEEVNLDNPAPGTYIVRVIGYSVPTPSVSFNLYSWSLGNSAAGNMTATNPVTATLGGSGTITIGTSGLAAGMKYLGAVDYSGVSNLPGPTIIRIDTP